MCFTWRSDIWLNQGAMKYNQKNEEAYKAVYQPLFDKLNSGKFLPNIPAIKYNIRKLNHSIDILCSGANFAKDLEELKRIEDRLDALTGQMRALQDVLKYVKNRIK